MQSVPFFRFLMKVDLTNSTNGISRVRKAYVLLCSNTSLLVINLKTNDDIDEKYQQTTSAQ